MTGCIGGWAEFTCNYTEKWGDPIIKGPHGDTNKEKTKHGRILSNNDEKNGHIMLLIEDLKLKDSGEYVCAYGNDELYAVKLKVTSGKRPHSPIHYHNYVLSFH